MRVMVGLVVLAVAVRLLTRCRAMLHALFTRL